MKIVNIKDLREQKIEQLYKDLASTEKELRDIRFKLANRELKDITVKSKLKKKIAIISTIIREKEYAALSENIK